MASVAAVLVTLSQRPLSDAAAATSRSIDDPSCQAILEEWMWTIDPVPNEETNSLSVEWAGLDSKLAAAECSYKQLWLELWIDRRGDGGGEVQPAQWTREVVHQYGYCDNLNGFRRHSVEVHHFSSSGLSQGVSTFPHVVERRYVFRMCPCGCDAATASTRRPGDRKSVV